MSSVKILGVLLGPTGEPIKRAKITFKAHDTSEEVIESSVMSVFTDSYGTYLIDVVYGSYLMTVSQGKTTLDSSIVILDETTPKNPSVNDLLLQFKEGDKIEVNWGIEEAPDDGQKYARQNKAWSPVQGGSASVDSVNGKTGDVILDHKDVGALGENEQADSALFAESAREATKAGRAETLAATEKNKIISTSREGLEEQINTSGSMNSGKLIRVNQLGDGWEFFNREDPDFIRLRGYWDAEKNIITEDDLNFKIECGVPPNAGGDRQSGIGYIVIVAGSLSCGGKVLKFEVGDTILWSGDSTAWMRIPSFAPVTSVNKKTGAVVLNASDVGAVSKEGDVISGGYLTIESNDLGGGSDQAILYLGGDNEEYRNVIAFNKQSGKLSLGRIKRIGGPLENFVEFSGSAGNATFTKVPKAGYNHIPNPPIENSDLIRKDWADKTFVKTVNNVGPDENGNVDVSGGGGGAVDSVNGKTGKVVLDAADVGAIAETGGVAKDNFIVTGDKGAQVNIKANYGKDVGIMLSNQNADRGHSGFNFVYKGGSLLLNGWQDGVKKRTLFTALYNDDYLNFIASPRVEASEAGNETEANQLVTKKYVDNKGGSGSTTFVGLTDTPDALEAGKILEVDETGTKLILADKTSDVNPDVVIGNDKKWNTGPVKMFGAGHLCQFKLSDEDADDTPVSSFGISNIGIRGDTDYGRYSPFIGANCYQKGTDWYITNQSTIGEDAPYFRLGVVSPTKGVTDKYTGLVLDVAYPKTGGFTSKLGSWKPAFRVDHTGEVLTAKGKLINEDEGGTIRGGNFDFKTGVAIRVDLTNDEGGYRDTAEILKATDGNDGKLEIGSGKAGLRFYSDGDPTLNIKSGHIVTILHSGNTKVNGISRNDSTGEYTVNTLGNIRSPFLKSDSSETKALGSKLIIDHNNTTKRVTLESSTTGANISTGSQSGKILKFNGEQVALKKDIGGGYHEGYKPYKYGTQLPTADMKEGDLFFLVEE